jgi:hypothetical protein
MTTPHDLLKRDLAITNIDKYHSQGYTGKGVVILNGVEDAEHTSMTNGVIRKTSPNSMVLNSNISSRTSGDVVVYCNVTINGVTYKFEEAIDKFHIKIVTMSKAGTSSQAVRNYFKDLQKSKGLIFVNSAGNNASAGVDGIYTKDNTAIAVGAVYVYEDGIVSRMSYSAIGEELDFMFPLFGGSGTSAAGPGLAGGIACMLQKYGDFTQEECYEILKSISKELGEKIKYGWGMPILPLTDKLEILEKLRGEKMPDFKDIEETRWSKAAIDRCVEEGLLIGFEDGTFRPIETVTREQFAVILTRILDKIEGR